MRARTSESLAERSLISVRRAGTDPRGDRPPPPLAGAASVACGRPRVGAASAARTAWGSRTGDMALASPSPLGAASRGGGGSGGAASWRWVPGAARQAWSPSSRPSSLNLCSRSRTAAGACAAWPLAPTAHACRMASASGSRLPGSPTSSRPMRSRAAAGTASGIFRSTLEIRDMLPDMPLPAKGVWPASISYRRTPIAQMSTAWLCSSPLSISGDR
mmetsp:Transcript_131819/g.357983  ORF Transcript_131819/g.357983 Transcript_131819/m.357983 type:complete len:217 (+) Transcript_131819:144-794(+)